MARLRLSGGDFRGRTIPVPAGVRPTGARVREALFSIWGERLAGARLLDLFAGAGAVGFEALGRGAAEVVLVESRPAVARRLVATRERLAATGCRVVVGELPGVLAPERGRVEGPFDLVFADPPYGYDGWAGLLAALEPLLAAGASVALEQAVHEAAPSPGGALRAVSSRAYGETRLLLLER